MPTTPVSITALPTAPSTTSPSDFDSKADAFLGALPTLRTEVNSVASITYNNAVEASGYANAAQISASVAGAVKWTGVTSFGEGAVSWSPSNYQVYRKISSGTSTTPRDPGGALGDTTNWVNVSPLTTLTAASTYIPLIGTLGTAGVKLGTGTGSFNIANSYYLGLGTTDPASMIHLNLPGGACRVQFTTNTNTGTSYYDGSYIGMPGGVSVLEIWNYENNSIVFGTSNQQRAVIDASGNVGIGLTPTYKFEVSSTGNSVAKFTGAGTSALLRFADSTAETGYVGSGNGVLAGLSRTDFAITASTGGALALGTDNTERVRIDNTGRMGINRTGGPTVQLDVNGGLALRAPTFISASTYTVLVTDYCVRFSVACTVTLPAASSFTGRILRVFNLGAVAVISAASNVVQSTTGTATTAILAATAGKWADLQSDGTNWYITAYN